MKYLLVFLLILTTGCTYQTPPPGTEWTPEEQRQQYEQQRKDNWLLTLLAIIPGAIIAGK